jgi:uncharacterized membrane protein YdjX (TVP38/TMEM64 family)
MSERRFGRPIIPILPGDRGRSQIEDYLFLFAIVFGVNLMPAFGPPTWSIIVIYGLQGNIPLWALVIIGAIGAALGRFVLAVGFRYLRSYVPRRIKENLEAAGEALEKRRRGAFLALGLFALSPVPSAQLFEAAGLTGVRLLHFTAAFFAGRLVSYSIYGATAKGVGATSIGATFKSALTSPGGIALQVVMLALLVLLAQIDWKKLARAR